MVIPEMRLSPVCSARVTALRGQRRTADPIPDWLRVPTRLTFHPAGEIVKPSGPDLAGGSTINHRSRWRTSTVRHPAVVTNRGNQTLRQPNSRRKVPVFDVGTEMLSPIEHSGAVDSHKYRLCANLLVAECD